MSLKKELWLPGMDEQSLIIPEAINNFLEVQIPVNSTEAEFEKMLLVNNSATDFLEGKVNLDTYLDILEFCGINPSFHLQEAAWQCANLFDY